MNKLIILIAVFSSISIFPASAETGTDKDKLAMYPGSKVTGRVETTGTVTLCSNDPANKVIDYYKETLSFNIQVQVGSKDGPVNRILLDVTSALDWRKSKKYIDVIATKDKLCPTRIILTGLGLPGETVEVKPKVSVKKEEITKAAPPVETEEIKRLFGVGLHANTLNFSAGPTIVFWPFENIGISAFYGSGEFTSYEARLLYRFNLSERLSPYIGAGFIHAEKDASTSIGVDATIEENSYTLLGGVHYSISNRIALYAEVIGSPLELEEEVRSSTQMAEVSVDYVPVSIGTGVVFYLW